jgi:hypothetical protein
MKAWTSRLHSADDHTPLTADHALQGAELDYFLGLSWEHTRGSALIGWVGGDVGFIAGEIEAAASLATETNRNTNYEYERARRPEAAGAIAEGV